MKDSEKLTVKVMVRKLVAIQQDSDLTFTHQPATGPEYPECIRGMCFSSENGRGFHGENSVASDITTGYTPWGALLLYRVMRRYHPGHMTAPSTPYLN